MLDVIVLVAMAVTAAAFAAGLILHSGIAQIPALIAAGALYMVMAASYLMVARTARPTGGVSGDRLNDLEAALEMIDKDLQRIDRVEEDVSRLDLLSSRVERLDQAMGETGAGERAGGLARFDQFAQEFDEVHAKIENLRADLEGKSRNQREKMTGDLRTLEGLIKQLSHELIATAEASAAVPDGHAPPPPALAEIEKIEPDDDDAEDDVWKDDRGDIETLVDEEETVAVIEIEEEEIVGFPMTSRFRSEPHARRASRPKRAEDPPAAKPVMEEEPLIAADTARHRRRRDARDRQPGHRGRAGRSVSAADRHAARAAAPLFRGVHPHQNQGRQR